MKSSWNRGDDGRKKNYDLANCQSQIKQKTIQTCQNINAANCNVYRPTYYDAIHTPFARRVYTTKLPRFVDNASVTILFVITRHPYIFFYKYYARNLVWKYGRLSSIPFLKSSILSSSIFYTEISASVHLPFRSMPWRYGKRCEVRSTQILNVPHRTAILAFNTRT